MISYITIVLFLVYLLGLGFTSLYFLPKPESRSERHLLYIMMGLGVFPILAIVLNFLHIPLDWKVFLGLSLIFPVYVFGNKLLKQELKLSAFPSSQFKLPKSSLFLLAALLIFAVTLFMYT